MKVIRKVEQETNWEEIKEKVRAGQFTPGDEIEIDGALWRVLDSKAGDVFIWKHTGIEQAVVFDNCSNKYEGSNIQAYARGEFLNEVPPELKALVSEQGFFPLSIDEVRRYLPTEGDRIAVDDGGETVWWCLRSAYRSSAYNVWTVYASGTVTNGTAGSAYRFAPACHLTAI